MDINQLAAHLEMDPELYRELLALFVENTRTEMDQLKEALGQADYIRISRLAHSVKGAAVNLGLDELSRKAESLESAADEEEYIKIESIAGEMVYTINELARLI